MRDANGDVDCPLRSPQIGTINVGSWPVRDRFSARKPPFIQIQHFELFRVRERGYVSFPYLPVAIVG